MKVELPDFKRCCFFIPLRYGLLTMAYMKLIIMFVIGVFLMRTTLFLAAISLTFNGAAGIQLIIAIILLLLTLLDISFTIVFLVGGHLKNINTLRVYSTYCIVCMGVYILLIVITLGLGIYLRETGEIINDIYFLRLEFVAALIIIGSHAYFFLLLRSEIIKLKNNCSFKFVNNTDKEAETLCTLENGINANEHGTATH